MQSSTLLPDPEVEARLASQRLSALIRAEIESAGGWISFARYMELALYAPQLGYYSAATRKFGRGGDFVTAPWLTPLFGHALAQQAAQVLAQVGGDILELGPGSGHLALDLLDALATLGQLPERYHLLEVSGNLRERQQALIEQAAAPWRERVVWLNTLPERFTGLILANEVLDALPVHRIHWTEAGPFEQGVAVAADGRFVWQERPLAAGPLLEAAQAIAAPPGYVSEIGLAARGLVTTLAERLERGVLLFLDYGFPRREYYHPQRQGGTLMAHRAHRAHADPFDWPGLTDLTAHVDFTAVAEAGYAAGLQLLGYTDQASFLINCGILAQLADLTPGTPAYLRAAAAVQRLLHPAEMGELFKALALGRGVTGPLLGFVQGDRSARL